MRAFLSQYSRAFRDRLPRVVWDVLRPNSAFAYAVRMASMILRTARFLCVPYAEIRVNATAVNSETRVAH